MTDLNDLADIERIWISLRDLTARVGMLEKHRAGIGEADDLEQWCKTVEMQLGAIKQSRTFPVPPQPTIMDTCGWQQPPGTVVMTIRTVQRLERIERAAKELLYSADTYGSFNFKQLREALK